MKNLLLCYVTYIYLVYRCETWRKKNYKTFWWEEEDIKIRENYVRTGKEEDDGCGEVNMTARFVQRAQI